MSDTAELLALAERCEAATGPSLQLNLAIFRALNPAFAGPEWKPYASGLRHVNDSSDARCLPAPEHTPSNWTGSIDAAMMLAGDNHWRVEDHPMAGPCAVVGDQEGYARTPALALVAAALRALAK